jgi:uncharacterized delta-60 repeat protein
MKAVSVLVGPSIPAFVRSKANPGICLAAALLACAALMFSSSRALAQAGALDPTFGTAGVFADGSGTAGTAVALQNDGKIVAGGVNSLLEASVVRLNTNGTLDSTFGANGNLTINFPGINLGPSQVIGLAIQSDGKIIAGISNLNADANPLFVLARLNANGSLDPTFGTAGVVETQITAFGRAASVLALQPDGKILLAGESVMARYTTQGQLDSAFGAAGVAPIAAISPTAMALQPDGKILIAAGGAPAQPGFTMPLAGLASLAGTIARYNPNGSADTAFGISGQAASLAAVSAIAVKIENGCVSTCKILVAGTTVSSLSVMSGNHTGFGLLRFNGNGSIDTTFGKHGGVITGFASTGRFAAAYALVLQPNGDMVAAGVAGQPGFGGTTLSISDFALARYSSTGVFDTTFGSGGTATTALGTSSSVIYALALQSDGKIVAVGSSLPIPNDGPTGGLVVARYLGQ